MYQAAAGATPPEIAALGRPQHVHRPTWIYRVGRENPVAALLIGLGLLGASVLSMLVLPLSGNVVLTSAVTLAALAGLGFVILAVRPFQFNETYAAYPGALVIHRGGAYTMLRWDVIRELNAPRSLVVADGQRFGLAGVNDVEDLGGLYNRVKEELTRRLLPPALATLESGGTVTFGEFALSRRAIGHGGSFVSWEQVGQVTIQARHYLAERFLIIAGRGQILGNLLRGNLNAIPNDWLFLDLVRRVCPPRLLVKANI
jgi:hypothetical protein